MSPGTFYGRLGDVVANSNPFINAAGGAPVYVHSPGHGPPLPHGYQLGHPVSPRYAYPHPQGHPPHPLVTPPHYPVTHGAYLYATSSPRKGAAPTGVEPKGYFDPMYFRAGVTSNGLANEAMRDKDSPSEARDGDGQVDDKDKLVDASALDIFNAADALAGEMSPTPSTSSDPDQGGGDGDGGLAEMSMSPSTSGGSSFTPRASRQA